MTIIRLVNGKELKAKGTVAEIVESYKSKPNTRLFPSRIDDNIMISIKGVIVGQIVC